MLSVGHLSVFFGKNVYSGLPPIFLIGWFFFFNIEIYELFIYIEY